MLAYFGSYESLSDVEDEEDDALQGGTKQNIKRQSVLRSIGADKNLQMFSRSGRTINKQFSVFKDESKSDQEIFNQHEATLKRDIKNSGAKEWQI